MSCAKHIRSLTQELCSEDCEEYAMCNDSATIVFLYSPHKQKTKLKNKENKTMRKTEKRFTYISIRPSSEVVASAVMSSKTLRDNILIK